MTSNHGFLLNIMGTSTVQKKGFHMEPLLIYAHIGAIYSIILKNGLNISFYPLFHQNSPASTVNTRHKFSHEKKYVLLPEFRLHYMWRVGSCVVPVSMWSYGRPQRNHILPGRGGQSHKNTIWDEKDQNKVTKKQVNAQHTKKDYTTNNTIKRELISQ